MAERCLLNRTCAPRLCCLPIPYSWRPAQANGTKRNTIQRGVAGRRGVRSGVTVAVLLVLCDGGSERSIRVGSALCIAVLNGESERTYDL
jgi:hypothetical protein